MRHQHAAGQVVCARHRGTRCARGSRKPADSYACHLNVALPACDMLLPLLPGNSSYRIWSRHERPDGRDCVKLTYSDGCEVLSASPENKRVQIGIQFVPCVTGGGRL